MYRIFYVTKSLHSGPRERDEKHRGRKYGTCNRYAGLQQECDIHN